jgi:3-isopropylmalate dehydrogenase
VQDVLAAGKRTGDIAKPGQATVSTSQMGDAILAALDKRAA